MHRNSIHSTLNCEGHSLHIAANDAHFSYVPAHLKLEGDVLRNQTRRNPKGTTNTTIAAVKTEQIPGGEARIEAGRVELEDVFDDNGGDFALLGRIRQFNFLLAKRPAKLLRTSHGYNILR